MLFVPNKLVKLNFTKEGYHVGKILNLFSFLTIFFLGGGGVG